MIDEGQTSPAPDILLYDHKQEKTLALIEVTHWTGVKKDISKVLNLLRDYDVQEGFVYDYKKNFGIRLINSQESPLSHHFAKCSILNWIVCCPSIRARYNPKSKSRIYTSK
jgi:hypothetical protein